MRIAAAICAAALAVAGLASAAAATATKHRTLTAASGSVSPRLTYDEGTRFGLPRDSRLRLSITRAGAVAFDAPPGDGRLCGAGDALCTVSSGALSVRDIEGNGEPDVTLDLYTGGAHCCTVLQVYAWNAATKTYTVTSRDFGDPGARVVDVAGNGQLEFESADDRFAYAFSAYAFSGLPIQIWRFADHRFIDVTRFFPTAVAADARRQYTTFRGAARHGFGLGFIAAWAADEELLGHRALVDQTLVAQLRAGRLRSADNRIWPGGRRFISGLKRMLRRTGYLS